MKKPNILIRTYRGLGPIAAAMILDAVDLATFGPLGFIGLFIGLGVGWWLGSLYNFKTTGKVICSAISGIYCLIPLTAPIPIATIVSAIARFCKEESGK